MCRRRPCWRARGAGPSVRGPPGCSRRWAARRWQRWLPPPPGVAPSRNRRPDRSARGGSRRTAVGRRRERSASQTGCQQETAGRRFRSGPSCPRHYGPVSDSLERLSGPLPLRDRLPGHGSLVAAALVRMCGGRVLRTPERAIPRPCRSGDRQGKSPWDVGLGQMPLTFSACGPLGPCVTSNSTFWPS